MCFFLSFFLEVEVLLRKTLDKTGLLQRHFILTAEKKQSLLKKTTFNTFYTRIKFCQLMY
jgi:hypothetical protein